MRPFSSASADGTPDMYYLRFALIDAMVPDITGDNAGRTVQQGSLLGVIMSFPGLVVNTFTSLLGSAASAATPADRRMAPNLPPPG